jgi:putative copper export protein
VTHDVSRLPLDFYTVARWTEYTAALITVGAAVVTQILARVEAEQGRASVALAGARRTAARTALIAPLVLLLAHLLRLYGQVRSFLEPGEPITRDGLHAIVAGTTWGHGWIAQATAAVLAVGLLALACRLAERGQVAGSRPAAAVAALTVGFTSPLTGHAMEFPWGRTAGVALHGLHLLGGGTWLGSLLVVFLAGFSAVKEGGAFEGASILGRLVRAFSPVALAGAGVATVAGLLLGLAYIGSFSSLWGTNYGRAVLIKLALLAFATGLGAYNWRVLTPRLETSEGAATFRGSASAELTIGALILVVTAVLVALPAPTL